MIDVDVDRSAQDILQDAAGLAAFLAETVGMGQDRDVPLSCQASHGLFLVLSGIEQGINVVIDRLEPPSVRGRLVTI